MCHVTRSNFPSNLDTASIQRSRAMAHRWSAWDLTLPHKQRTFGVFATKRVPIDIEEEEQQRTLMPHDPPSPHKRRRTSDPPTVANKSVLEAMPSDAVGSATRGNRSVEAAP